MTSEASGAVAADAAPRRFSRCAIASDPECNECHPLQRRAVVTVGAVGAGAAERRR